MAAAQGPFAAAGSVSRAQLKAYVTELADWLETTHQLTFRKASICVAISQLGLTQETLTTRKKELQFLILAAARGELVNPGEAGEGGDTEFASREARLARRQQALDKLYEEDSALPWDVLSIGNPYEDEENHSKALLVVGEYFADFREPLGQQLWDVCIGKELPDNTKRKIKTNRDERWWQATNIRSISEC